jgi:hypothetical protein
MAENKKVNGTSDMQPVEVLDYNKTFQVTDLFLNDLKLTLKDVAYADAIRYFDYLANYKYILPIAILNEFLKMLSNLPMKYVAPLFAVIQNKELFPKYFVDITPNKKQQQVENPENKEVKNA